MADNDNGNCSGELMKYSKELEEDLDRELVSVFCTLYMGDC